MAHACSTVSSDAVAGAGGAKTTRRVAEIMRRGGAVLRERMVRTEEHLERVAARGGRAAGGARDRHGARRRQAPASAAGRAGGDRRGRAARTDPDHRGAEEDERASCEPPWRSSWCTPRRSSTTT